MRTAKWGKGWPAILMVVGLLSTAGCAPGTPATPTAPVSRTDPFPGGFVGPALTAWLDGSFVVIGGEATDNTKLTAGYRLDPATGAWTPIAPAPQGLSAVDVHVVKGSVLYVAPVTLVDRKYDRDGGPWVCDTQSFLAYDLAANTWTKLPLPDGECSLDPHGLVATPDAVVAVSTGARTSWKEGDPQWEPIYPQAVDAVFSLSERTWKKTPAPVPGRTFRWATSTPSGLLVVAEPQPGAHAFTSSSPATPAVYSWDYNAGMSARIDRPGSESLDWKQWTGRVQGPSGPVYFQDGALLSFDTDSGTFRRSVPTCGSGGCTGFGVAGTIFYDTTGASDLGTFDDSVTFGSADANQAFLVDLPTGKTTAITLPGQSDPSRGVLDAISMAGGGGTALSCPLDPRSRPEATYVDSRSTAPAALTQNGNAGTGEPGVMIRVWVAESGHPAQPSELAVKADGTWTYEEGSERSGQAMVQRVEYVHSAEMQPYCYLVRY